MALKKRKAKRMSSSSFLTNPRASLIADASVVINLNATGRAADIIKALPNPFIVTDNACSELEVGVRNGHRDHAQLLELIDAGLVRRASLGNAGVSIYRALIDGSTLRTLDDGEAATIAYACEAAGVALIDERKAWTLCTASFPALVVASTVELLTHNSIAAALGEAGQADALTNALMMARMRVPPEHLEQVTAIIGAERAAACASLPQSARRKCLASERALP
jgi:predicted nucleic acid-binding protein